MSNPINHRLSLALVLASLTWLALGAGCGDDIAINSPAHDKSTATGATAPSVAFGATPGEFMVAMGPYPSFEPVTTQVEVQRVNASTGAKVGGNVPITNLPIDVLGGTGIAYGSNHNQYLVVATFQPIAVAATPIYGQLVTAAGAEVGPDDFLIASSGGGFSVVYDPSSDEYLVVWIEALGAGSGTIRGQRIDGATGALVGTAGFPIASTGGGGFLSVVYNPTADEYLVVASVGPSGSAQALAQRLDSTGALLGSPLQVSQNGVFGNLAAAYSDLEDRYLVVWPSRTFGERDEIYGQLLDGATGAEVGTDDFQISTIAGGAFEPSVAYDTVDAQFVVSTHGYSETTAGAVPEMFYQRVEAHTGASACPYDIVISDRNPVSSLPYYVVESGMGSGIAASTGTGRFLSVWGDFTLLEYVPPPPPGGTYIYEYDVDGDLSSSTNLCGDM